MQQCHEYSFMNELSNLNVQYFLIKKRLMKYSIYFDENARRRQPADTKRQKEAKIQQLYCVRM